MSTVDSKTYKVNAFAALEPNKPLTPYSFDYDAVSETEVLIQVSHCGICHSDIHLMNGDWGIAPSADKPMVCGHEVVGKVIVKGSHVKALEIGDVVGVGWLRSTCPDRACNACLDKSGDDQMCSSKVETCGNYNKGGFADKIKVDSSWAFKIPSVLPPQFAAPLLCAGVTVYSPLERLVKPGEKVAILSLGGLGALAVQFASAMGAVVTAVSRGTSKKERALTLGAKHFIDSNDKKQLIAAADTFDVILVCGPYDSIWNFYISMLRGNGKLVFVAVPPTALNLHIGQILGKQISIHASSVGGRKVTNRMLQFAADHKIHPMIEEFPFADINKALDRVNENSVRFRAVLVQPNL